MLTWQQAVLVEEPVKDFVSGPYQNVSESSCMHLWLNTHIHRPERQMYHPERSGYHKKSFGSRQREMTHELLGPNRRVSVTPICLD